MVKKRVGGWGQLHSEVQNLVQIPKNKEACLQTDMMLMVTLAWYEASGGHKAEADVFIIHLKDKWFHCFQRNVAAIAGNHTCRHPSGASFQC